MVGRPNPQLQQAEILAANPYAAHIHLHAHTIPEPLIIFFFFLSLTDVKMTKDPHSFIIQAISQMLFKCFHACLGSEKRLLR